MARGTSTHSFFKWKVGTRKAPGRTFLSSTHLRERWIVARALDTHDHEDATLVTSTPPFRRPTQAKEKKKGIDECEAEEWLRKREVEVSQLYQLRQLGRKTLLRGDIGQFLWIMCTMYHKGWVTTISACGEKPETIVKTVARKGSVEDALRAMECLPPSHKCFHLLIETFGKKKKWSAVLKIFRKLEQHETLKPNKHTYRYMISAAANCERSRYAKGIFRSMAIVGVKPDVYTYNALLHALGDDIEEISALSQTMKQHCDPDRVTFNTILNVYARIGGAESALECMHCMKLAGLEPDIDSYNAVYQAFFQDKKVKEAFELKAEMVTRGINPDLRTWSVFLRGCGRAGQIEEAFTVWHDLQDTGQKPNEHCYNSLMSSCLDGDGCPQPERALQVFRQMTVEWEAPPVVSFNIAIKAASYLHDIQEVESLLAQMHSCQRDPSLQTWSTVVDAYAEVRDADGAQGAFQQMCDRGIQPDAVTYTSLIKAYVSVGRVGEADEIYKKMCVGAQEQLPRKKTYNTLIRGFRESGDVDRAMQLYQKMRERGFSPNNAEFRALLESSADMACTTLASDSMESSRATFDQIEWSYLLPPAVRDRARMRGDKIAACVDLHGLSTIEARAAVLCILRALMQLSRNGRTVQSDLVFITGAGNRSAQSCPSMDATESTSDPPLRSAVTKLLRDELHLSMDVPEEVVAEAPGVNARLHRPRSPANRGRLVIRKGVLEDWLRTKRERVLGAG
uniref:PROP1-like PPR domain-containing protein n=1 Tax=Picocystis salinarum TaxID=88271 RepID=A0A6U9RH36_9CHLO|mmetsp:Transcript_4118/g.25963  ORF Transcript_4118/g.25963 Transcript_4118/m.25963 type:complete len:736 (-) Transcript_4118:988-3195(-)